MHWSSIYVCETRCYVSNTTLLNPSTFIPPFLIPRSIFSCFLHRECPYLKISVIPSSFTLSPPLIFFSQLSIVLLSHTLCIIPTCIINTCCIFPLCFSSLFLLLSLSQLFLLLLSLPSNILIYILLHPSRTLPCLVRACRGRAPVANAGLYKRIWHL